MSIKSLMQRMQEIEGRTITEGTKETGSGRIHRAEPGGYGRKLDTDDEGVEVKPEAPKRGRGRPRKGADSETGEVKDWDTETLQRWIVGSVPKNLPGKTGVKHKIKDESLAEGQTQLLPGKFYVVNYQGQAVDGPFDSDLEAEPEKAEYSGGGKEDAAIAQWTGKDWNFDYMMEHGLAEGTKETSTGRVHKAEPGGYGRKDDGDSEGKKVEPQVKRGRGRPKKNADSETGEVKKWDTDKLSSWIIGNKPKTLPGKPGVKHKLKDWMEYTERQIISESIVNEGRMGEISMVLQDIINGNTDLHDVLNHPRDNIEEFVSKHILKPLAEKHGLDPVEEFDQLQPLVMDELGAAFGEKISEVTLDPSQVAAPQIKAPGATTPASTGQQPTGQQPAPGSAKPGMGMAVIDFKDPNDPLKAAMQKAVQQKDVAVMATESKQINEGSDNNAERLQSILRNYPMEHRMALEGWGVHESLYQALCDHYWDAGKIPRDKMTRGGQELRDWVEECYSSDTAEPVMENPLLAVVARGMAAGVGAAAANKFLGDDVTMEEMDDTTTTMEYSMSESKKGVEESGLQAYLGKKKYGEEGMEALQKAGREGASKETMADIRAKYDKLEEQGVAEGRVDEKLTKSMTAGEIISDFVGSKDPKFKGISKKKRTNMALGAYYGMHPEKSKKKADESKDAQMESWSKELNALLNEGLTITTSTGNEHSPDSVSVNATDADAHELMKLVQSAGLGKKQSASMSTPGAEVDSMAVEPVSQDEVMGTLEPEDDGVEAFGFLKRMLGARGEHGGHSHGDYEQEGGEECGECGHTDCQCDHEEVDEMHNQAASPGDANMSALPEELHGGQKKLDLNKSGSLDAEDFKMLRAKRGMDEEALDQPATMEGDDWADAGEQDLAAAKEESANEVSAAETEKEIAVSEGEETCNECGGEMYEGHECGAVEGPAATGEKYGLESLITNEDRELTEWANSPDGKSTDEAFLADLTFMTKTISGGLNNIKQDQTVLPGTRVKTDTERASGGTSMAEMLRKLANIN